MKFLMMKDLVLPAASCYLLRKDVVRASASANFASTHPKVLTSAYLASGDSQCGHTSLHFSEGINPSTNVG